MSPRRLVWVILLGSVAAGCQREAVGPNAGVAAAELKTVPVTTAAWTPEVTLDGTLEPIASVQLGFDVPGRISALLTPRGTAVNKGEAIAKLDDSIAAAQYAQAQAALAGAEAQLAAGEAAWGRAQALNAAGGMSAQQFKEAEAGVLGGRAGVEQARAGVQMARTNLNNHTLRAPIAGTLTAGPDNAGTMIGAGTPLFYLEDLSALQLKGSVPEGDSWIREGMSATVHSSVPGSDATVEAKVVRVIPALDPVTRRLPVELRIDAPPPGFLAHGYAKAEIRALEPMQVTLVPHAAIVARPEFSVVVQRGEAYERVIVDVLREEGENTLVRGKLAAGDVVVLYPPSGLGGEG